MKIFRMSLLLALLFKEKSMQTDRNVYRSKEDAPEAHSTTSYSFVKRMDNKTPICDVCSSSYNVRLYSRTFSALSYSKTAAYRSN